MLILDREKRIYRQDAKGAKGRGERGEGEISDPPYRPLVPTGR
jgi:hypothetical protein